MANLTPRIPVGFFNELKHGRVDGPSLKASVQAQALPNEAKLVAYLRGGTQVAYAPGIALQRRPKTDPIRS